MKKELDWQIHTENQEYLFNLIYCRLSDDSRDALIEELREFISKYEGRNEVFALEWLENKRDSQILDDETKHLLQSEYLRIMNKKL